REVFAVPGSPLDPRAEGCNSLLKEGATLVTEAADVITVLRPILGQAMELAAAEPEMAVTPEHDSEKWVPVFGKDHAPNDTAEPAVDERARTIALLGPTPVPIDDLVRRSESSPAIVRTVLFELELAGRLERHGGALVSLAK